MFLQFPYPTPYIIKDMTKKVFSCRFNAKKYHVFKGSKGKKMEEQKRRIMLIGFLKKNFK